MAAIQINVTLYASSKGIEFNEPTTVGTASVKIDGTAYSGEIANVTTISGGYGSTFTVNIDYSGKDLDKEVLLTSVQLYGVKDLFLPVLKSAEVTYNWDAVGSWVGEISAALIDATVPASFSDVKIYSDDLSVNRDEIVVKEETKIIPNIETLSSFIKYSPDISFDTFTDPNFPTTLRNTDGTVERLISFRDNTVIPMKDVSVTMENTLQFNLYLQIETLINSLLESYGVSE
jgi:hypothetical protein